MALLGDDDTRYLRESFSELRTDVTVSVVTKERSRLVLPGADEEPVEDMAAELKEIVGEVAATSPRIKVEYVDAAADAERAASLVGERTPAMAFTAPSSKGRLRYYGLPAGYEMSTLVAALMDLGAGEAMVPPEIADELGKLPRQVHVQVFVTPS